MTQKEGMTVGSVLVSTDLSEESTTALRYAAALAGTFGATLHIVHVSEIDYAIPGPALLGKDVFSSDDEEALTLKRQLAEQTGSGISPTFHGRIGRAFDQIVRCAREIKADLIVMATHGPTGLKRIVLGSNAERVVQHSSSPVLIVREQERELFSDGQQLRVETILVPTDFSEASREGLDYALEFARQFKARVCLFHSFSIPEFMPADPCGPHNLGCRPEDLERAADAQMREWVRGVDFSQVQFATEIRAGRAAEAICERAEKQRADVIITSTHGRTGLMHVLIGSVAEHVVRYAHCPVLVVPRRSAAEH